MAKNIMICFDGTSNHPRDAKQEREWFGLGDIEDNGITNILKLHVKFGGDLRNRAKTGGQHSFYYSGVGTYGNRFQQIFNAGIAPANKDVGKIIKKAGKDLRKNYKAGDKIFIFGFSRGAAIARRFATVIDDYIKIDEERYPQPIRFLGVFDTVAAMGLPNLDDDNKPVSDVVFENNTISKYIEEALHLISVDENRIAFQPTLMNKDPRVTEIWFPGAHSDVGGGFWYDGLSDVALEFIIKEFSRRDLATHVIDDDEVNYGRLKAPNGDYQIDYEDVFVKPNHKGKAHPKDRWLPIARATLGTRDIRVNENNDQSSNDRPLLHHSVVDRIVDVMGYRPKALKGVKYKVLQADGGTKSYEGLREHIKP